MIFINKGVKPHIINMKLDVNKKRFSQTYLEDMKSKGVIQDYEDTDINNIYDSVDFLVTAQNGSVLALEYKYREKYSSDDFKGSEGILFEKIKYDALQRTLKESGCTYCFYITEFNDKQVISFDITKMDCQFIEKMFPKSTYWNKQKIPKKITYLKIENGRNITK